MALQIKTFIFSNQNFVQLWCPHFYLKFFCLISALFVKKAGIYIIVHLVFQVIWEIKLELGMSKVFQMPRAANWPNWETRRQLCEWANDAEGKKNDLGMTAKMRHDALWVDTDDWITALNTLQHYLSLCGCESMRSVCHAGRFLCLSLKVFVPTVHSGQATAWRRN